MKISVLGRIGYDLFAEDHGVPLKDVRRFSRFLGGSAANMAVGLRRLGTEVAIISCLGEDALADYLIEYLEKEGVDARLVQRREGAPASLCLTEVSPPERFPQVFYRERAADTLLEVGPREQKQIVEAQMFITNGTSLCASPSRESTYQALEWAHQMGVTVAFDVDYRSMSWSSPAEAGLAARLALPFIDVLIANPEEIRLVAERSGIDEAISELRERVPLIVAKLGSEGTRAVGEDGSWFVPPFPVEVVSTIGAGDGFASGFLYARLKGMDIAESLRYGNAAAAIVVSRLMCSEAMPRLGELTALLEKHPGIAAVEV